VEVFSWPNRAKKKLAPAHPLAEDHQPPCRVRTSFFPPSRRYAPKRPEKNLLLPRHSVPAGMRVVVQIISGRAATIRRKNAICSLVGTVQGFSWPNRARKNLARAHPLSEEAHLGPVPLEEKFSAGPVGTEETLRAVIRCGSDGSTVSAFSGYRPSPDAGGSHTSD